MKKYTLQEVFKVLNTLNKCDSIIAFSEKIEGTNLYKIIIQEF